MVTFLISAAWISAITYVLVWMVTIAGRYLNWCCYTSQESLKKLCGFPVRFPFESQFSNSDCAVKKHNKEKQQKLMFDCLVCHPLLSNDGTFYRV